MITNETEIRIALQAVLVSFLALYGFWGCALVVLVVLLPWKPLLAVGGYLAQPVVDWRMRKARERHEGGIAQIEQELDDLLRVAKNGPRTSLPIPPAPAAYSPKPPHSPAVQPMKPFQVIRPSDVAPIEMATTVQDLVASLAIPRAIESHVRNLPQGAFSNMDLEMERVEFHGDNAEAYVKFHSPNVKELVIRQRYVLRKSGEKWQVESRQPANGSGHNPPQAIPGVRQAMRLS